MGPGQRYASAIGWIADHVALLLFFLAGVGGATAVVTASMSTLSAYAPFSYVIAGLVGIILTTAVLWSSWAFIRWVRSGGEASKPIQPMAEISGPKQQDFTTLDDGKRVLADFATGKLGPAIKSIRELQYKGATFIRSWEPRNAQSECAWYGACRQAPPDPPIKTFGDVDNLRSSKIFDLETEVINQVSAYFTGVSVFHEVVAATIGNCEKQKPLANDDIARHWYSVHKSFMEDLLVISRDPRFPNIRDKWNKGYFKPRCYPKDYLSSFLLKQASPLRAASRNAHL